jgi:cobalt-zinc-cadmium efflux system protein
VDNHGRFVGDHTHSVSADADGRYLTIALLLIVGFMAFEVVVGIVAHSLALLSDAAHMLTDAGALALSLVVLRYVRRPGGEALTYGRRRAEVLSGQANGAVLLVLGLIVIYEAISRLITPPDVAGLAVTMVAAAGVVVNLAAAWVMAKANRHSLNIEGSFQHILTDLYAFIGTLIAGIVILVTGFDRADAIASLLVAGLMLRSGGSPAQSHPRAPRRRAGRDATCRGRRRDGAWRARERGARSALVGTCAGPSHLDGACPRHTRGGLPCGPPRARADAERALQDRTHDTAGRSRAPARAVDSAAGNLAFE